jgi:hypothetical protein
MSPELDIAAYQAKQYPQPPCWALVADVYTTELGETVNEYRTVSSSVRAIASAFRLALHKTQHGFHQVAEPADFAVVLMGKTPSLGLHHCGVFYGGKVLHANPEGTMYQDLASLQDEYQLMEFWSK